MKQVSIKRINRINYIVQENPNGVSTTLLLEGIQPSGDLTKLIAQTKLWIQKGGKDAIVKLLQVHPEKNAIISANTPEFQNYDGCGCGGKSSFDGSGGHNDSAQCKCKSSFDGTPCPCNSKSAFSEDSTKQITLKKLAAFGEKELLLHYKDLKRLLEKFPDDNELRTEVEVTWEYLKSHKELDEKPEAKPSIDQNRNTNAKAVFSVSSKDLAIGSFIFGVALIVSQIR
jgi:hypothetical protein